MSQTLPDTAYHNPPDKEGNLLLWDSQLLLTHLQTQDSDISLRTVERTINTKKLVPASIKIFEVRDELGFRLNELVRSNLEATAKAQRQPSLVIQQHQNDHAFLNICLKKLYDPLEAFKRETSRTFANRTRTPSVTNQSAPSHQV